MTLPNLYFSRPAIVLPDTAVDNEKVLSRVRDLYTGPPAEWDGIEQTIRYVFDRCNTKMRYLEEDDTLRPGEFASRAATACLEQNGMAATDIDLLVYGGIARDAFEPATAAEVAGRIGARPLHATDVTCACAGLIEAMHVVAGYFAIHPEMQTALICAGEVMGRLDHLRHAVTRGCGGLRRRLDVGERRRRVLSFPGSRWRGGARASRASSTRRTASTTTSAGRLWTGTSRRSRKNCSRCRSTCRP